MQKTNKQVNTLSLVIPKKKREKKNKKIQKIKKKKKKKKKKKQKYTAKK